jgi:hypothetical protein
MQESFTFHLFIVLFGEKVEIPLCVLLTNESNCLRYFPLMGLRIWNEQSKVSSTHISAPALLNSPQ